MIRTLLVDDEQPARERLQRLLTAHSDVEVVAEACDGGEALEKIAEHAPDLVFLDIEMPQHSGIEVAATMPAPRPQVIFCTAFDSYAVAAFEHNALDYLLKPVNRRRLAKSLDRIRQALRRTEDSHEIQAAGSAQRRLFPGEAPGLSTLDFYGSCRPARGVGGDYYDFFPLGDGRYGFALGDVSGKGVYAGLLMAGLQGRLQSQATRYEEDLGGLFRELNDRIWDSTEADKFATLVYALYDDATGRLGYVNAGHPAPLHLRGGRVERLDLGGLPLGLFPHADYAEGRVRVQPADVLIFCSDGLLEAEDPHGAEFGAEGVVGVAQANLHLSAYALHNEIIRRLDEFKGDRELADDLTLMVLKARSSEPGEDSDS